MILNMERYSRFLCQFEEASRIHVRGSELERLKEEYKDDIDSKRVLESIVDVGTLLKVLEKRGVLQYDDVSVLRNIAQQFVKDESVDKLIADYAEWLEENSGRISNCYSCAIVPKADPVMPFYASNINVGISVDPRFLVNQTQYHATAATLLNDNIEKQLQDRVANKIARKIGKFWRDVSRRLNIEEAEIESIEMKYFKQEHGSEKMFKEALQLYFSENPRNWKLELMRALELSKRRDLKELVEELIHQPN